MGGGTAQDAMERADGTASDGDHALRPVSVPCRVTLSPLSHRRP
jgi:hypothetical protein